jgi:endonuclease/exonuclease/phosphatase family metal-dependent hydrolase
MGYIIGSFNTCRFTGIGRHDIGVLADIILSERFDIVALQEVFRPDALNLLKRRLPGWEGCHGRPGNGPAGDFGFAFLWNTKRARECSKDSQPIIFEQYKSNIRMRRNPFYGRFTPSGLLGGAFFEIRLIDVHLWWGSQSGSGDITQRNEEYRLVTNEIHNYINTRRYGDNMPAYTIILGDYNLWYFWCQQNDKENQNVKTKQEEKTTLSSNNTSFANDYDHFSYDENRFLGTSVIIERVNSVAKYCQNDFEKHKEKVSDHVPIKLELMLN